MPSRRGLVYKNEYMPVSLRLRDEKCLVVGGGNVAFRKIEVLREFGARITCLSPRLISGLERFKAGKKMRYVKGVYSRKTPLKRYKFVIAATDNLAINRKIAARCKDERILVNVVNKRAGADVIMPAILEKGSLLIAVSTGGRSCSRAKKVRDKLRDVI
jgi:siroheme synthase-like protein